MRTSLAFVKTFLYKGAMPQPPAADAGSVRTRRAILDTLKREGPREASALAAALGVTTMAVRQHLYELTSQKLITAEVQARPIGRPAKLWRLTPAADRYFPDAHAELTVGLITAVRAAFGPAGMEKMLAERKRQSLEAYRGRVAARGPLRRRVEALAELRSAEGYMAEVATAADGALLLIENHCPICAAAAACQGLCVNELELFREVLGPGVRVERIEHIQAGARRCAYRVEPE
jgi:predicted ArsR family transcriptional regulator